MTRVRLIPNPASPATTTHRVKLFTKQSPAVFVGMAEQSSSTQAILPPHRVFPESRVRGTLLAGQTERVCRCGRPWHSDGKKPRKHAGSESLDIFPSGTSVLKVRCMTGRYVFFEVVSRDIGDIND